MIRLEDLHVPGETLLIELGMWKGYTLIEIVDKDLTAFNWCNARGYSKRGVCRSKGILKAESMHRIIVARMGFTDLTRKDKVDHINGLTLDNRRSNLRVVSNSQNLQNRTGLDANNTTGYRGVWWEADRLKYRGCVELNGRVYYTPRNDSAEVVARDVALLRRKLGFNEEAFRQFDDAMLGVTK